MGRGTGSKSGTQDRLETFERALGSLHQLGFAANVIDVDLIVGVINDLPAFGEADEVIINIFICFVGFARAARHLFRLINREFHFVLFSPMTDPSFLFG